jgi:hypothetical protein
MTRFASVLAAVLLVAAACPAFADDAADIAAIEAQRAALGKAYEDGDADAVRAMLTPDQRSVAFVYDGPVTVDEQIATLKDLDVEVYDALAPKVDLLGPGSALVTTEQSYRGTFKGNPLPGRVFIGEVWVKVDGKWLQKFYQETVIEVEE